MNHKVTHRINQQVHERNRQVLFLQVVWFDVHCSYGLRVTCNQQWYDEPWTSDR